jgi:hypothetical protein
MTLALRKPSPVVRASALVTEAYCERVLTEQRMTFAPWCNEMRDLHQVASPEPIGIVG